MELNLHSSGGGLFGTHITWEDIEKQIQDETNLNVFFGPKKCVQLIGEGNGFLSRIALIEADFQQKIDDLPSKFIVKMTTALAGMEVAEAIVVRQDGVDLEKVFNGYDACVRDLHNREVNVYRIFSRFDNSISKIPRIHFSREFTERNELKGFIGMEYVDNTELRHIHHNITPNELSEALRAIAYIEAKSLQLSDEEKKKLASNPIPIIYSPWINADNMPKMFHDMYTASEELKPSGEVLEKIADELILLELTSTMNEELGMKDVLVHGDLWAANLLWKKTVNGMKLNKILDYQLAHFGCAAVDLSRLFITTLSGKDRRENWEQLIEEFHGYLNQYCEEELPFTLEQLKESYRRLFPLAGVLLLDVFDPVAKVASQNLPDEEKAAVRSVLMEKTVALFEDMLFYAKRNREVRKNIGK